MIIAYFSIDIALEDAFCSMCQISKDRKEETIQGVLLTFRTDNGQLHHGILTGQHFSHHQFVEDALTECHRFGCGFIC